MIEETKEINVFIRLPFDTGDILAVNRSMTLIDFTCLIRETQDLEGEEFDLYFNNLKMSSLFKTLKDY